VADDKNDKMAGVLQPAADEKYGREHRVDIKAVPPPQAEDDYDLPRKTGSTAASKASTTGKPKTDRMYDMVATSKTKDDRRYESGYENMTQKQKKTDRSLPKEIYL
jgi:hypothetical protein